MDPSLAAARPATRDEAIDWLRKHFHVDSALGLRARFEFDLSGPGGGAIQLSVDDGRLEVGRGRSPSPDVCLRLTAHDCFGIFAGSENADLLYMAGRVEIDGDLALAMKLRALFRRPA